MQADPDFQMALRLQQQFNTEFNIDNPSNDLTYLDRKKKNQNLNTSPSKCLIDPSWELVDPTPNIHILFVQFNERFFWNKLLAVTVEWSKRMTVCAGICSYQGRCGMCSITLSEPLLKLRPRKDLIETLLHEMIHAYLFVTHNNRDRDGHGPEFHKHMYRINKEAGTSISVYHNFHDEVRLYQQHWWRCDGPCQQRPPFFGMVRRSINRAPGPNDRWWAQHQQNCNGKFIKVREPEKKTNKKNNKTSVKGKPTPTPVSPSKKSPTKLPDIRNHFPVVGLPTTSTTTTTKAPGKENISTLKNIKNVGSLGTSNKNSTVVVNPKTSSNNKSNEPLVASVIPSTSNIKGFSNSTSTSTSRNNIEAFSGSGKKLSNSTNSKSSNDSNPLNTVRNHWANKFVENKTTNISKRKSTTSEPEIPKKVKIKDLTVKPIEIPCPNCNKLIPMPEINSHLDACMNTDTSIISEFSDDSFGLVECPVCNTMLEEENLNTHLDECLTEKNSKPIDDEHKQCEICENKILVVDYSLHVADCLSKFYAGLEKDLNLETPVDNNVKCLVCNKDIVKSDLNLHLEDCMGSVFDKYNIDVETGDSIEEKDNETNNNKEYNCPICMSAVNELNMNSHIDECLNLAALNGNLFD